LELGKLVVQLVIQIGSADEDDVVVMVVVFSEVAEVDFSLVVDNVSGTITSEHGGGGV